MGLCHSWCKESPQLLYEIDSEFLLSIPVSKAEISSDCYAISVKATEDKSKSSLSRCLSFSVPDATYWAWVLCSSQQRRFIFLSDSEHANSHVHSSQRSASSLKGLSMQMVKYTTHSKFSLRALAQLAETQGDFRSNLISDSCAFPNIFQSISNHLIALVKELTTFFVLTLSYFTFHCLKGKWTLPNQISSLQESLNWLITIDPLKDLDI